MGEESSGSASPPDSPLVLARRSSNTSGSSGSVGRRGAADTIMEECERLFCDTMVTSFRLREGCGPGSLMMGSRYKTYTDVRGRGSFGSASTFSDRDEHCDTVMLGLGTPSSVASSELDRRFEALDAKQDPSLVARYLEVWDYTGGAKFKGFTTVDKAMFVFFDEDVLGRELKQGLMALIELASTTMIGCERLVVCLERGDDDSHDPTVMRDLRWVGFEPTTLAQWADGFDMTSDQWILLEMEV